MKSVNPSIALRLNPIIRHEAMVARECMTSGSGVFVDFATRVAPTYRIQRFVEWPWATIAIHQLRWFPAKSGGPRTTLRTQSVDPLVP